MAGAELELFLRHMRPRVLRPSKIGGSESDAELISHFVRRRNQEAFELLVWRHGLMVLNVCRRVSRHEQDAEDAFPGDVFRSPREADAIGNVTRCGSWLYKVAYRLALAARKRSALRSLPRSRCPILRAENLSTIFFRVNWHCVDEEIRRFTENAHAIWCFVIWRARPESAAAHWIVPRGRSAPGWRRRGHCCVAGWRTMVSLCRT